MKTRKKDYHSIALVVLAVVAGILTYLPVSGSTTSERLDQLEEKVSWLVDAEESRFEYQITRYYKGFLGRAPDSEGLKHWVSVAMNGTSLEEIADKFLASEEYKLRMQNLSKSYPEAETPFDWRTPYLSKDKDRYTFQAMQAQRLRKLGDVDNVLMPRILLAKSQGFTGLHVYVETDWFTFDSGKKDFRNVDLSNLNEGAWEILANVYHLCQKHGLHLHVWLWGDSDHHLNLLKRLGEFDPDKGLHPIELQVYQKTNEYFAGKEGITFGVGWDLEEWLTLPHAMAIANALDIPVAMRHPDGIYNEIADIPCLAIRNLSPEKIRAFRAKYPKAPTILLSDRTRIKNWLSAEEKANPANGHHTFEQVKLCAPVCEEEDVSNIWGRFDKKQERYEDGSEAFDEPVFPVAA